MTFKFQFSSLQSTFTAYTRIR